ncbi:MAG: VCBS repeat-containing protein [Pyrinomonadaceae bacterium]|nr:VCBS repeat-containing protein [Acidobacteriota bacterium]MBK7932292.1 VCBS repeat-containing protein [Acidobacteriota bacterium]MBP7375363.1 VCBS repeat-containing protein [Pyrinomonadaceae bacterium]
MRYVNIRSWLTVVVFFVCLAAVSGSAQSGVLRSDVERSFSRADVVRVEVSNGKMRFRTAGGAVEIALQPHDLRAPDYRAENTGFEGNTAEERRPVNTFIGTVNGDSGSNARLNLLRGGYEGFFELRGTRYFIEPAINYSAAAEPRDHIIYRPQDAIRTDEFSCGSYLADKIEYGKQLTDSGLAARPSGPKRIEIATDADLEYVNILGSVSSANDEILGILNTIEGLYSSDLNLSIAVTFQHTWTTPDPYAGANTELTVRSFQAFWNANYPLSSAPRDTAHLFSGKAHLQSQGWAFIGVICNNPNFAYGMSGYINWSPGRYLVTGHELAHNLGANHAEIAQSCGNSLMNAQLSGGTPLSFCQYSRTEIDNFVNTNGACMTSRTACQFDLDGDAKSDIAVFRPTAGEWWFQRSGDGGNGAVTFGEAADKIVPADLTGDGTTDIAIWRPSTGFWYVLRSEDRTFYAFPFGTSGDTPVPADFDGDGKADPAIFRPASNTWFIDNSNGGMTISQFGTAGDLPVNADYDGDGKADIAIFRPASGQWWIQRSTEGLTAFQFGSNGDRTIPGDFTGDGKADVAIWRPSNGFWSVMRSEDGSFYSFPFGTSGDIPVAGDYDGDGEFDAAVFRPSSSTWYVQRSTAGTLIQQFGTAGDLPVQNAFVR